MLTQKHDGNKAECLLSMLLSLPSASNYSNLTLKLNFPNDMICINIIFADDLNDQKKFKL